MATVSEKCNGTYGSHYTLYLEYSLNSQDYKNNCSNITVSMYGKSDSTSYKAYNTSAVNPVSLSVEGSTKVSKNISMDFRNKKTVNMASWTGNVYHNSRGELSVDLAGSFSIKGVSSLSGGSISRSWTLPTIPRESSVTCTDGNIGSSVTVNINRASSSFSHTITYNFQGLTGTIATKTGNTSIGWTLPTSFFAKIPNSKSASGTIKCETYDGSTYIGSSTCRFNAFVSNSEPTISATVEDVNATTIALTGNKNKLIKYKSTAKIVINATAKNSSSISSYKTVCSSKSASTATSNITEIESGNFDVSCTDSRGFTSSTTVKKEIVDYIKLAITSLELSRPNTTSNTVNISLKGNYFNASFGSVSNTLALKFRSRISGGTWGSYINLNPTKSGNTFLISGNLGSTYNFNNEYEFEFVATDKVSTITQTSIVSRGIPLIDIGKDDIEINADVNIRGKIQENDVDVVEDSGWIITDNMGSDFNCYGNNEANRPRFRKIGNLVEIVGVVTPSHTFESGKSYTIFTLPEGYRPSQARYTLCQGTGNNLWLLGVATNGSVEFSRYRKDASDYYPSAGNWLPFNMTFLVD